MKLSAIVAVLCAAYLTPNKQPVMLHGGPGVGKSSIVRQAAERIREQAKSKANDFGFIDLRLSLLEPVDLRGLPYFVERGKGKAAQWATPTFLPTSGSGILFLDEIAQASPSMQAAASQLLLDRRIGEYVLPDGWMVVAAGNRKSDRASVNAMPTHIINRLVHLTVDVSTDEWIAWALRHKVDIRIVAFIKWRPDLLYKFDPQAKGEAFASPRSWEFASHMLTAGIADDSLMEVMRGTVGEAAATEFVAFLRIYERMPSIDAILLNPASSAIPTDPATLYAVTAALAHRAEKDNVAKIDRYFQRIEDAQRPEYSVLAVQQIAARKPELMKTRSYCEWASRIQPLIA